MWGAVVGDIAGSRFEGSRGSQKGFEFFHRRCTYTDDTVCTAAIAYIIVNDGKPASTLQRWCRRHPDRGYGGAFRRWIASPMPRPYGSFGNGAAMRVSPVALLCRGRSLDDALALSDRVTEITHDHPEGIKGAREQARLARWASAFPYVNGGLFSRSTDVPRFSRIARSYLLHIGNLDWKKINPDIFGSMIQAVADEEERGALGMHYTSVPNILKVLNPLFLDDLRGKLEEAGTNSRKLLNLRNRMARIRVFDPACGSGNFLVIAYKEIRAIEAQINESRGEERRRSDIPLTNFRGIELRDFPAEIARLALIIAEYQCDVLYRGQREALAEFLPLDAMNWITCGNALRLDWLDICPPTGTGVRVTANDLFQTPLDQAQIDFENEGGENYVCGNPPYLGSQDQDPEQKEDLEIAFQGAIKSNRKNQQTTYPVGSSRLVGTYCDMADHLRSLLPIVSAKVDK